MCWGHVAFQNQLQKEVFKKELQVLGFLFMQFFPLHIYGCDELWNRMMSRTLREATSSTRRKKVSD